ncbi:MAG TPA: fibronectin type III domain-containing protein, partial [Edaphobacter sp.]
VADLAAERVGDEVHLHWTTSSHSTDRLNALTPITAEVCREASPQPKAAKPAPPPQTVAGCDTVLHLTVKPGATEADDRLPAPLTAGAAALVGYRVRLLNPKGHSAGYSNSALVPAGEAPAPVAGLKATATRNGAMIEWQPNDSAPLIELDRTLVSAAKPAQKKAAMSLPEDQPAEIRLRSGKEDMLRKDPGGTLDRSALRGQQYSYTAQRIRVVTINGTRYEMRSAVSAPLALAMKDSFPPAAPTGLAAIPGSQGEAATIDLSWQPDVEPDVSGYNVYRREGAAGSFERVTAKPALGPAFSDATVAAGHSYTYRVTAVDSAGNESAPSSETTETAEKARDSRQ